jgi:hypothetical protein
MEETHASEYWSMSQASKMLGINKGMISQDVSKGKIQWHERPDGTKKLFVPELYHVYADKLAKRKKQLETAAEQVSSPESKPTSNGEVTGVIEAKEEVIALLKSQLEEMRRDVTDIKQDRDHWRRQAEQATEIILALPAPNPITPVTTHEKRGFVARLFGRPA